jgi:protoheme IX farnesyltransferase
MEMLCRAIPTRKFLLLNTLSTSRQIRYASTTPEASPPITKELRYSEPKQISVLSAYASLSKPRLSALVILTAMVGVAASPLSATPTLLAFTTVGTGLCVGSANIINQWMVLIHSILIS